MPVANRVDGKLRGRALCCCPRRGSRKRVPERCAGVREVGPDQVACAPQRRYGTPETGRAFGADSRCWPEPTAGSRINEAATHRVTQV